MATLTDPARELNELLQALLSADPPKRATGDEHVAHFFQTAPCSLDYYRAMFVISERIEYLNNLALSLDEDIRLLARSHLSVISLAFGRDALSKLWTEPGSGSKALIELHLPPLIILSGQIRQKVTYPNFDPAEAIEIAGQIDQLLEWLKAQNLKEQDFIRQALVEGLSQLSFRFHRMSWLGWGYAAEGLREVVGAYMALERGFEASGEANPIASAIVTKVGVALKGIMAKVNAARDWKDNASLVLEVYRECAPYALPAVTALLTHGGS